MTLIAHTLEAFFCERLIAQRNSSPQTIAAYRDTLRLLLRFAQQQTGKPPYRLDFDDLDAQLIGAFLTHLETERGNSPRDTYSTVIERVFGFVGRHTSFHRCSGSGLMFCSFELGRRARVSV